MCTLAEAQGPHDPHLCVEWRHLALCALRPNVAAPGAAQCHMCPTGGLSCTPCPPGRGTHMGSGPGLAGSETVSSSRGKWGGFHHCAQPAEIPGGMCPPSVYGTEMVTDAHCSLHPKHRWGWTWAPGACARVCTVAGAPPCPWMSG